MVFKNGAQNIVVGIANLYALEGPGFEPRSGQGIAFSPYPSRPVMGPTWLPLQLVLWLLAGSNRPGTVLTTHPPASGAMPAVACYGVIKSVTKCN